MTTMQAPNGAIIEATEEAVKNLLDMGFTRVSEERPRRKAAPRKRTATKEQEHGGVRNRR